VTETGRKTGDDLSTIMSPLREPPLESAASFVVEVIEGPDRGASVVIDATSPSRLLVGKSAICALFLKDPRVSRRHLALDVAEEGLRVADLGSTNGTTIGDVRVVEVVAPGRGELLRLGETVLRISRAGAAPVVTPMVESFGSVLGQSPEMRRLYPLCERLAASDVPLVIEGETGTGKEILAEALHERSARASGPFVVFDCTTVPANLIEATLFGHERGAFTGAVNASKGLFQEAHGGTLLIDEIGDLDVALQPKLLRAIERAEVRPLGGNRWIGVDVRVMAATRRDLDREIQAGRFRDDLFYRLAVARIELPPLRKRRGDVAFLARHFWEKLGGNGPLPYDFMVRLESHDWPGNVRELHNAVARRLALGDLEARAAGGDQGSAFPDSTTPSLAAQSADSIARVIAEGLPLSRSRELVVDEFERRYVENVLERHQGDATRAAQASGIARRYFQLLRARQAGRDK
jgi:two-component system response regulator HydG